MQSLSLSAGTNVLYSSTASVSCFVRLRHQNMSTRYYPVRHKYISRENNADLLLPYYAYIYIPIFVIGVFKSGKLKKIKESIPSPPFLKRWRGDYMGGGGRRPRLPIRLKLNHPPLTRLDFSIFFFLILFAPFSSLFDVHTRIRSAGLSQFVYRVGVNRFVSIV